MRLGELAGTPADRGRIVMEKLAPGEISAEHAVAIMQCITAHVRIVEIDELENRIASLEATRKRR